MPDANPVFTVMREARRCAGAMLEAATYIRSELPSVPMADGLRARTEEVCSALVGTKHDVVSELFEMDELLDAVDPMPRLASRARRLVRWLKDDVDLLRGLVDDLEAAARRDPDHRAGHVLVAESAAGIMQRFAAMRAVAEDLDPPSTK